MSLSVMDKPLCSLYNGLPGDLIPVSNRAFRYGDGVFETCVIKNQVIELWDLHYARLAHGCQALEIGPLPSQADLFDEIAQICPQQGIYILKIVVSRAGTGRAYRVTEEEAPDRLISIYAWQGRGNDDARVKLCQTRQAQQPELAGIKHLNRLEQVLGSLELDAKIHDEGILCDFSDAVISGTMSNLFCRLGDGLLTPALELCGVAGTMRACVLETAKEIGIETVIRTIKLDEIKAMDGLFLTNSLWAIKPVKSFENRQFDCSDKLIQDLMITTNKHLGRQAVLI